MRINYAAAKETLFIITFHENKCSGYHVKRMFKLLVVIKAYFTGFFEKSDLPNYRSLSKTTPI